MKMKPKYKIMLGVISFIILVNVIGFLIAFFTDVSLVLRISPINRAYVFAHGEYLYFDNGDFFHISRIDGKPILTNDLLNNLRNEGYDYIWISMCEQGNEDYIISDGVKIEWGEDVSRVKKPGTVYPIYWGLGVYRLTLREKK